MKIYLDTVRRFSRPNNTDWQYNFVVAGLSKFDSRLEFYVPMSWGQEIRVNARHLAKGAFHLLARRCGPLARLRREQFADRLCRRELDRAECDLVFSHREFPANVSGVPLIWQNSILDPAMASAQGITTAQLDHEFRAKRSLFARATLVQVSTEAEAARLADAMPELASRFRAIPFLLPHLNAIDEDVLVAKHSNPAPLRILFVGREAHRKGLPEIISALRSLAFGTMGHATFTVISDFRDGHVELPQWKNLVHYRSLPREEVVAQFRNAHLMVMPSRLESYGFVYIEAMSQGVVPMVPDWEVQREIVADGSCGVIVRCEPKIIAEALSHLITDHRSRLELAINARNRYRQHYSASEVAARFATAFFDAKALGPAG